MADFGRITDNVPKVSVPDLDFVKNVEGEHAESEVVSEGGNATETETSEKKLAQEKKSDLNLSGKLLANQLSSQTKASDLDGKTAAAQQVEKAIEEARAKGGSQRDAIVAGAKADAGNVDVGGGYRIRNGEDRLKEVYKSSGIPLEKNQKYDRTGQPIVQLKEGKGSSSWCGVWAHRYLEAIGMPMQMGTGPRTVRSAWEETTQCGYFRQQ